MTVFLKVVLKTAHDKWKKDPPRRGIEPRSPAYCYAFMTGGDTNHYTNEDIYKK